MKWLLNLKKWNQTQHSQDQENLNYAPTCKLLQYYKHRNKLKEQQQTEKHITRDDSTRQDETDDTQKEYQIVKGRDNWMKQPS